MDNAIEEIWKNIPSLGDNYEASSFGRIRSLDRESFRQDTGTILFIKGAVVAQQVDQNSYRRVRLLVNKEKLTRKVHRLIAEAFIDNPENKPQVNHIDGNKSNNEVSNLEWVDNSDNQRHAIEIGLKVIKTGQDAARFKRAVDVFKDGEYIITLTGNADMAEKGFDFRLVSACLKGKRKTHRGCTFKVREV
jgi:hypothetical protein